MEKTIIANWGHAAKGKSETIKQLTKLILENYSDAETKPIQVKYHGDIKVIITIGNCKIGVESQGDPNSRIFSS